MTSPRLRVLFLCTGNAARSQMAEAIFRQLTGGRADVFSAGVAPAAAVLPAAKAVLEEKFGLDTTMLAPKSTDAFLRDRFDFVVTVCDNAAERCPLFPGDAERIHWSFDDPAREPTPEAQQRACRKIAQEIVGRLRTWMSLPGIRARLDASGAPSTMPRRTTTTQAKRKAPKKRKRR